MNADRIQPYEHNPAYWQYKGRPVLLLGGSVEDNPFQLPATEAEAAMVQPRGDHPQHDPAIANLEYQFKALLAAGGNFLRCSMSSRDIGDVWPYARDSSTGKYDLDTFSEEYWSRFERFLRMAHERAVMVQLEIWETYDYYQRETRPGYLPWQHNPCNPANNLNYTSEASGLPEVLHSTGTHPLNPFFETVPGLNNNSLVLEFQHRFVDQLLSISLAFDNVLYCMDNETHAHPEWGAYWARYIDEKARGAGRRIELTEMWDNWDPTDGEVAGAIRNSEKVDPLVFRSTPLNCLRQPDVYTFSDISNHNAQRGETHYQTGLWFWRKVREGGRVWPIHCDKMYGGDEHTEYAGTRRDGLERFWRNIFAGFAGCRFHRPPSGLGLDPEAQAHLRSMRNLTDALGLFTCEPRPDLLSNRQENTAFCLADPGRAYAVVFVNRGSCSLDIGGMIGKALQIRWLDIASSQWSETEDLIPITGSLFLQPPSSEFQAVLVTRCE
ncbi:MAG: hypothetical protein WD009_13790 [Phycisphaeraceae bacterium]